ncbi:hypothetical protein PG994_000220 [Apiospora phragmitis]|uniref:Uncharacterized protein n=1 Tax=Apiospora phragmitis TaxID=2905665 RepID=A0ABR1X5P3_9PEZI
MATFEATRDFRAAAQDPKRAKERYSKWSRGSRPLPGSKDDILDPFHADAKVRPQRAFPEAPRNRTRTHNIVKAKTPWDIPHNHSRAKVNPMEEMSDPSMTRSLIEMLPSSDHVVKTNVVDRALYSFDRVDSPGKPLSLDVFVKSDTKGTEKLIEREYEVLDINGDALKGRKARRILRHPSPKQHAISNDFNAEDVDGFQLVKAES